MRESAGQQGSLFSRLFEWQCSDTDHDVIAECGTEYTVDETEHNNTRPTMRVSDELSFRY